MTSSPASRHASALTMVVAALAAGCASSGIDFGSAAGAGGSGRALIEAAVEAHGGNLFSELSDLNVSYEGEWGRVAPVLQRVIADKGYRKASQERYLLADGTVYQRHRGPKGTKTVLRTPGDVRVEYGEAVETDGARRESSALVADVYLMLSTGPSFFLREGVELTAAGAVTDGGKTFDLVRARLTPGFGFSPEDRAQLWIDRASGLLHRVQFTLEGYERTRGAQVDVIFSEHREIAGRIWPTRFDERIRKPLDVFAHRWWLTGLDVDRGLELDDLAGDGLSPAAAASAAELAPAAD